MATATVPETTPTRKLSRAYFANFLGLSGAIVKPAAHVVFVDAESGATITLTDADYANLTVLGEVGDATVQYARDLAAGGAAKIVCGRQMLEVA